MNKYCISIVFILLMVLNKGALAQTWTGINSPSVNQTLSYSYHRTAPFSTITFTATSGAVMSSTLSTDRTTAYVVIRWNTPGSGLITLKAGTTTVSTFSVSIGCGAMSAPTQTTYRLPDQVASNTSCVGSSFRINATKGTNGLAVNWYHSLSDASPFYTGDTYTTPALNQNETYYISTLYYAGNISIESVPAPTNKMSSAEVTAVPAGTSSATQCESSRIAVPIVIVPVPTFSLTGYSSQICSGESALFQVASNPYAFSWTVNVSNVSGASPGSASEVNVTQVLTNTSSIVGSATYTFRPYANGCYGTPVNATVNVKPLPSVSASGQTICSGASTSVVLSNPNGIGGTIYNWSANSALNVGGSSSGTGNQINQILNSNSAAGGSVTYNITATAAGCAGASLPITINVKAPVAVTGADQSIVTGEKTAIALSNPYGTNGTSYTWTVNAPNVTGASSGGGSSTIAQKLICPSGSGCLATYSVVPSANGCTGSPKNIEVNILTSTNKENYIMTNTLTVKNITDLSVVETLTPLQRAQQIEYFDGTGRRSQIVNTQSSPAQFDIVQPVVYDSWGRENKKYLPYRSGGTNGWYKINSITDQADFYSGSTLIANDTKPFAETIFEPSPLNRPVKQGAPGAIWQPGTDINSMDEFTTKYYYGLNKESEIYLFTYDNVFTSTDLSGNVFYPEHELVANRTYDEKNNSIIEYTDKKSRVVCKKVQYAGDDQHPQFTSTYYVYDDFGNLVMVLPPEAVAQLKTTNAFQYKYDGQRRMTHKKVPGAAWVYMVYDNRDRLVMTQDGNQRLTNQWSYTKYDALNRPIITGLYTHPSTVDQSGMSALISTINFYETFDSSLSNSYGYTDTVFPVPAFTKTNFEVLAVSYYDNYDFKAIATLSSSLNEYAPDQLATQTTLTDTYPQEPAANGRVIGQVTGSLVKVKQTGTYLLSVNYYDDKYQVIQSVSDNAIGGKDRITNIYDFTGNVLAHRISHNLPSNDKFIIRTFTYDHAGRLLTTHHSIDGATPILLVKNEYNELGQLIDKNLHSTDGGTIFKQSTDYRYNIRGWLTSINNAELTTGAGTNNVDNNNNGKDLFGMELAYEKPVTGLTTPGDLQFNGNISAITYSNNLSLGSIKSNGYKFTYDALNRLKESNFRQKKSSSWDLSEYVETDENDEPHTFSKEANSETGFDYDLNGNIKVLNRSGAATASNIPIDQLGYTYNGNQLLHVDDAGDKSKGFIDGNVTGDDYSYDENGNMTMDKNKGITAITYNHMNLPVKVMKNNGEFLQYIYDATGRKLSQQVYDASNNLTKKSDYVGEYFYENDVLQFINHEEGRVVVVREGQPMAQEYQYHLKDHLGNVRTTFTTKEETEDTKATLETTSQATERSQYVNYDEARTVNSYLFDHTNNSNDPTPSQVAQGTAGAGDGNAIAFGGYAVRLTGIDQERIGLIRSLSVMPGDKVDVEVWAKYIDPNASNTPNLTALINGVKGNGNGLVANTVVDGLSYHLAAGTLLPFVDALTRPAGSNTVPRAYLNWLVFNREGVPDLSKSNFKRISEDGREDGTNTAHELLKPASTIEITEPGYVYIWLSNDAQTEQEQMEVFFDDFKVTHTKSTVVATDEYYPGGAMFNSYIRENSVINKRKYQSKEWQPELGLELFDFGPRQYDGWLLRTTTHDPHAENYYEWSSYSWAFDNPVRFGDPTGKDPVDKAIGFLSAVLDNGIFGGISSLRTIASDFVTDEEDFNTGLEGGDIFSMVSGIMEAGTGEGLAAGGTAVTIATGGAAGEVSIPAAVVGTGMAIHGGATTIAGANNFMNKKGHLEARQTESGYSKTKHTDNRHVDRNKYPEKSKYTKPNQTNKINEKTIQKPDKVTKQRNGRVVYEKDMKRKIGTSGQTTNKVVVEPKKKKIVTSYPTTN